MYLEQIFQLSIGVELLNGFISVQLTEQRPKFRRLNSKVDKQLSEWPVMTVCAVFISIYLVSSDHRPVFSLVLSESSF